MLAGASLLLARPLRMNRYSPRSSQPVPAMELRSSTVFEAPTTAAMATRATIATVESEVQTVHLRRSTGLSPFAGAEPWGVVHHRPAGCDQSLGPQRTRDGEGTKTMTVLPRSS